MRAGEPGIDLDRAAVEHHKEAEPAISLGAGGLDGRLARLRSRRRLLRHARAWCDGAGTTGSGLLRSEGRDAYDWVQGVKGEPVEAPTGRADNFAWPRTDGAVEDQIEPAEPIATAQPPRPVPPRAARAALPRAGPRPPAQAAAPPKARAVR